MAQMAQQSHLVIKAGYLGDEQSEEVKKQLRRAYLRGSLLDVIVESENEEFTEIARVLSYFVSGSNILFISFRSSIDEETYKLDCGAFQPDDYTDDTPTDEE